MKSYPVNIRLVIWVTVILAVLSGIATYRIRIDTDIIASLPLNDPVISDGRYILLNHPIHDQIVIDVRVQPENMDILAESGDLIEKNLTESGLFKSVGMKEAGKVIPELMFYIAENLPFLFSESELRDVIQPMTEPDQIRKKLETGFSKLQNIEGIGQSELISKDPLGFGSIVLAKLSQLAPGNNARIYKGNLISGDGRHLLVTAKPKYPGSDTAFARSVTRQILEASAEVNGKYADRGYVFTLTPAGAYRAALDNEEYAKADVQNSLLWSTVGIGLLLFFTFPRPLIGLLSFIPAFAGTLSAFFVFSLFHESVSIMTLGFGGAVISITVDQGIAYLLFLDQKHETRGKEAASEVWGIGVLATLTTAIAFLMLCFSGFPILSEIGQFATLGGVFSFLFVHTVFPKIFPVMPPAKSRRSLPVHDLINRFALSDTRKKAWAAFAFSLIMLIFAKPDFRVDLAAMNTVSNDTKAAETLMTTVWGNIFTKVYLMIEADNTDQLRSRADSVSDILETETRSGMLSSAFISPMVLPGPDRGKQNFTEWNRFWDENRRTALKDNIRTISAELGFAPDAFESFFKTADRTDGQPADIPPEFFGLTGISRSSSGKWVLFCSVTPGRLYDPQSFYSKFGESAKLFDPNYFSVRLGELLASAFIRMVIIVSIGTVIMLFIVFSDPKLTVIVLIPTVFAFVCTLGTLKLLGRPVDIPGILLSIVIMGMGVDYSICFVHSYRKYHNETHPSFGLIRIAVFLTAVSAIIGFGVLSFSNHLLLRSAGLTSALGVGYSLIGTFMILPAMMKGRIKTRIG